MYVHDEESRIERPMQELKGFDKVRLEPGASATVTFDLGPEAFSYWDMEAGGWVLEPGTFIIRVGGGSRAIQVEGEFTF